MDVWSSNWNLSNWSFLQGIPPNKNCRLCHGFFRHLTLTQKFWRSDSGFNSGFLSDVKIVYPISVLPEMISDSLFVGLILWDILNILWLWHIFRHAVRQMLWTSAVLTHILASVSDILSDNLASIRHLTFHRTHILPFYLTYCIFWYFVWHSSDRMSC